MSLAVNAEHAFDAELARLRAAVADSAARRAARERELAELQLQHQELADRWATLLLTALTDLRLQRASWHRSAVGPAGRALAAGDQGAGAGGPARQQQRQDSVED